MTIGGQECGQDVRRHFDLCVVIPLEEELTEFLSVFNEVNDLSTDFEFIFEFFNDDKSISGLAIQQQAMGKQAARSAVKRANSLYNFDFLVCLGIAGSISNDVELGDVVYSGEIIDVLDNAKFSDREDGGMELDFSPQFYRTYPEFTQCINYSRIAPAVSQKYQLWQAQCRDASAAITAAEGCDADSIAAVAKAPKALPGAICCGQVSGSRSYNKRLKQIDRKALVIETESGGVFCEALELDIPAITIRGVSDLADNDKSALEIRTKGLARKIAARNAASFLKFQLDSEVFQKRLKHASKADNNGIPNKERSVQTTELNVDTILASTIELIKAKLRELSPDYRIQSRTYRLPVPRLIEAYDSHYIRGSGGHSAPEPQTVEKLMQAVDRIVVDVPRSYPDESLPWVIAESLTTAMIDGKQVIPIVIDGRTYGPPKRGLAHFFEFGDLAILAEREDVILVYVFDDFPVNAPTKLKFLLSEDNFSNNEKAIFVHSPDRKILHTSDFISEVGAVVCEIEEVPFYELANFIQHTFSMTDNESEVIAIRLKEMFDRFGLTAHPTYFAGIPKEILSALLQANRRAELMQLAVDGYLTFVVAGDSSSVSLSRTTRSRFLRRLAYEKNVLKRSFTRADAVSFAESFFKEFDFDLEPIAFIDAFVTRGLLHFENDNLSFSLPFIERYLLALELSKNPDIAIGYFQLNSDDFDISTFDVYAEMAMSDDLLNIILGKLSDTTHALSKSLEGDHILIGDQVRPPYVVRLDLLEKIRARVSSAIDNAKSGRNNRKAKQKILDMVNKIKRRAEVDVVENDEKREIEVPQELKMLSDAVPVWYISTILLDSGAEHLSATTKQKLCSDLIVLGSLIIDGWTRQYCLVDFGALKSELASDENLKTLVEGSEDWNDVDEAKKFLHDMVDLMENVIVSAPFRRVIEHFCETARSKVLLTSIEKTDVKTTFEELLKAVWISDIDTRKGRVKILPLLKKLKGSTFVKIHLITHYLTRVYWKQPSRDDRLTLLDVADQITKSLPLKLDTGRIQRKVSVGKKSSAKRRPRKKP